MDAPESWPSLELHEWVATRDTLQLWLQIVGKVRLTLSPPINHSWQATLYVTSRGLTTSPIPHGLREFQIDFDFIDHRLDVLVSDGTRGGFALEPRSVADFYAASDEGAASGSIFRCASWGARTSCPIRSRSQRIRPTASTTPDAVHRFWLMLVQTERVMRQFRSRFIGKCSPIHLFWGAMDLAVTRFSGRAGARPPGRHPEPAGPDHARSVFARSQQLRILGGHATDRLPGVLRLRVSSAAGVCRGARRARWRVL